MILLRRPAGHYGTVVCSSSSVELPTAGKNKTKRFSLVIEAGAELQRWIVPTTFAARLISSVRNIPSQLIVT